MTIIEWAKRVWNAATTTPVKSEVLPPMVPVRAGGVFSTDMQFRRTTQDGIVDFVGGLADQAFQRTPADFVYQRNGTAVAMDSAEAKTAMDNISIGNWNLPTLKQTYAYGLGGVPMMVAAWYGSQSFIGYQMCAIISQHWLVDKACSMPARDAIRNGFEITTTGAGELTAEMKAEYGKQDKRFRLMWHTMEFVRKSRIYGIRIALFEVDSTDPEYYLKPFNADGVTPGSYRGIVQVDPYWITPELDMRAASDPASAHFYEPTFWRINGKRYHRTHLVITRTCDVPDVLKPTYFYGGIPVPQRIYERVYAAERTANEAPQLALSKRTTVIKGDSVAALANPVQFNANLEAFAFLRDNYGIKFIDKNNEDLAQFDTTLADFDALIMTQYQLVSAIAEVPSTKLLGTTPKGFNATGEYEQDSYYEFLESIQAHDMAPLIERHHICVMRSIIAPKFGIAPFETAVVFNEVNAESSKEKADRQNIEAQRFKALWDTGAVDGYDIRDALIADPESGFDNLKPIAAPDVPPDQGPRSIQIVEPANVDPGVGPIKETAAVTPPASQAGVAAAAGASNA